MRHLTIVSCLILFVTVSFATTLSAQLNNKPFSFKGTPDGGIGMSIGGKQAIIDQKILGVTAENLVRSSNGVLLQIDEGPGKSAIVSYKGGETIPSFRGTSWKGNNVDMSVGVFNSYFSPTRNSSSNASMLFLNSSATVSTWTTRVVTNGFPASYSPGSSVDEWTGLVY